MELLSDENNILNFQGNDYLDGTMLDIYILHLYEYKFEKLEIILFLQLIFPQILCYTSRNIQRIFRSIFMLNREKIVSLRMERQHIFRKADIDGYDELYKDLQPGLNVYWNGFGKPPTLSFRSAFDDEEYNKKRQLNRTLRKGRFSGGNLGWVLHEDFELFACLYNKPLSKPNNNQKMLLELLKREGPMNIQLMKEFTGLLVKEITPALHRCQEAFLLYEDQYNGEWDRAWYCIEDIFPNINLEKYSKQKALEILLLRFAYRQVYFTLEMAKSYCKVPTKLLKSSLNSLVETDQLTVAENGYVLTSDTSVIEGYSPKKINFVLALHRNDFLVKSNEVFLKEKFKVSGLDTLQYLLIDGLFKGVVSGKFKYGTNIIENVVVDLKSEEIDSRIKEILSAVQTANPGSIIKRINGKIIN